MRLRFSLMCIVAGISIGIAAYLLAATWWIYLPGFILSVIGLISLGTINSEADRSGMGPWGDSS